MRTRARGMVEEQDHLPWLLAHRPNLLACARSASVPAIPVLTALQPVARAHLVISHGPPIVSPEFRTHPSSPRLRCQFGPPDLLTRR